MFSVNVIRPGFSQDIFEARTLKSRRNRLGSDCQCGDNPRQRPVESAERCSLASKWVCKVAAAEDPKIGAMLGAVDTINFFLCDLSRR
jgi:hypothetical protein